LEIDVKKLVYRNMNSNDLDLVIKLKSQNMEKEAIDCLKKYYIKELERNENIHIIKRRILKCRYGKNRNLSKEPSWPQHWQRVRY
jgi:Zn/Cd-binding protein ZinT